MQIKYIIDKDIKLIDELVSLWYRSVKCSHTFLNEDEINSIKQYVPTAIRLVPNLIVCYVKDIPVGFIGINNNKIEMLFVDDKLRGKGIGTKLLNYAFDNYNIDEVVVNEENNKAHNFYLKHGFYDYKKEELDEQGNPYPIIIMKRNNISLILFDKKYIDDLINIFNLSIKITCKKDYNEKQIEAWLKGANKEKWIKIFESHYSLIASVRGEPVGFGDISSDGYLNMLYVDPIYQNKGVATLICDKLEAYVNKNIIVDVSITAKDFFLKRGYKIINEQTVYRDGIALNNYRMVKHI